MDDYILELPNFVSPKLCNDIVNIYKNIHKKKEIVLPAYMVNGERRETARFGKLLSMSERKEYNHLLKTMCEIFHEIYLKYTDKLSINFKDLNKNVIKGQHPYTAELESQKEVHIRNACTLHEIEKGGFYSWHHDYEWNEPGAFIQAIIYLNTLDEGEGGCTEFLNGRKVKPEIGKVLIYPRSWTYLHKGGEIMGNNAKYICTANMRIKLLEQ